MALLLAWGALVALAETRPSAHPSRQASQEELGLLVVVVDAPFEFHPQSLLPTTAQLAVAAVAVVGVRVR